MVMAYALMFSTAPRHEAATYQGMVGGAVTCGACEIWGGRVADEFRCEIFLVGKP